MITVEIFPLRFLGLSHFRPFLLKHLLQFCGRTNQVWSARYICEDVIIIFWKCVTISFLVIISCPHFSTLVNFKRIMLLFELKYPSKCWSCDDRFLPFYHIVIDIWEMLVWHPFTWFLCISKSYETAILFYINVI